MSALLVWMAWGAGIGAVAAVAITLAIVKLSPAGFFSAENYIFIGLVGAGVGAMVGGIGGTIWAWKGD
jgi:hypothetical protein